MGATREETNKIYLTTFQGLMVRKVPKGTPDSKMRINKLGDEVHELQFDTLSGYLDDIRLEEPPEKNPEYGKSWCIVIEDGDEVLELKLGAKGREASAFLSRLPNMDFSKPVKVKTYWIQGEDKIYRGFLAIHQNGEKVLPFYTKEEPHGCPDLEVKVVDGENHYDGSKRRDFLLRVVNEAVLPKIRAERPLSESATIEPVVADAVKEAISDAEEDIQPPTADDIPPDEDLDLPF